MKYLLPSAERARAYTRSHLSYCSSTHRSTSIRDVAHSRCILTGDRLFLASSIVKISILAIRVVIVVHDLRDELALAVLDRRTPRVHHSVHSCECTTNVTAHALVHRALVVLHV